MAPQQNSTLINENLEVFSSLLNIPEEINRYSPILPLKSKKKLDNNNNNHYKNNCEDIQFDSKCGKLQREPRQYNQIKHSRAPKNRNGHNHRSRSISLYGANSTIEQGHKEITIWVSDEPRYVSGVTNKTTCNDIIKALIDDEISNGNYLYCQLQKDGAASRDYSDYVITECWRGIERSYDGNMAILPVWKAWSRVHNEIRLSLKHHKYVQDPTKALKTNTTFSCIRNYICKLLNIGKTKKQEKKQSKISNKTLAKSKSQRIEKNISATNDCAMIANHCIEYIPQQQPQLPIKPNLKNPKFKEKQMKVKNKFEESSNKSKTKLNGEKLYKLSESRTSIRKRKSSNRRKEKKSELYKRNDKITGDINNFLRKRKDSSVRSSVRNKLAQKNAKINDLFEREYALTRELSNKFKTYKLHNDLYMSSDKNLELSVGQIQENIEACAKEIIQTEHELLEIKNEIKHDISIINNLKRLTLESNLNQCGVPIEDEARDFMPQQPMVSTQQACNTMTKLQCKQMEFVDNIYEFCDNNASMLV